jgi:hypothetical protein
MIGSVSADKRKEPPQAPPDGPPGWSYAPWRALRPLTQAEVDEEEAAPMVHVAFGLYTEPGWQRTMAVSAVLTIAAALGASRTHGFPKTALAVLAVIVALPMISMSAFVLLAAAAAIGPDEDD